ncbi:hypothetical protein Salat_1737900 [Sesamum alatum]|uniref:Uncharacterized protein n=1 Tax=Sesamum alatum TaxID=300844 RepID=A0AAE1Y842_9LAMI|nr:hypothetical protein Salat_1737900 [Sesamum alatum]
MVESENEVVVAVGRGENEVAATMGEGHLVVEGESEVGEDDTMGEGVPVGAGDAWGDVGDDTSDSSESSDDEKVDVVDQEGKLDEGSHPSSTISSQTSTDSTPSQPPLPLLCPPTPLEAHHHHPPSFIPSPPTLAPAATSRPMNSLLHPPWAMTVVHPRSGWHRAAMASSAELPMEQSRRPPL